MIKILECYAIHQKVDATVLFQVGLRNHQRMTIDGGNMIEVRLQIVPTIKAVKDRANIDAVFAAIIAVAVQQLRQAGSVVLLICNIQSIKSALLCVGGEVKRNGDLAAPYLFDGKIFAGGRVKLFPI